MSQKQTNKPTMLDNVTPAPVPAPVAQVAAPATTPQATYTPLNLPAPTNLSGSRNHNLKIQCGKSFPTIKLVKGTNTVVIAAAKDSPEAGLVKRINPDALNNITYIVYGALAGRGNGPDGAKLWIQEHAAVLKERYADVTVDVRTTRDSGLVGYVASVPKLVDMACGYADMIANSMKFYAVEVAPATAPKGGDEVVDFVL